MLFILVNSIRPKKNGGLIQIYKKGCKAFYGILQPFLFTKNLVYLLRYKPTSKVGVF